MYLSVRCISIGSLILQLLALLSYVVMIPHFIKKIQFLEENHRSNMSDVRNESLKLWSELTSVTREINKDRNDDDILSRNTRHVSSGIISTKCQPGKPGPRGPKGYDGRPGTHGEPGGSGRNFYVKPDDPHDEELVCQQCPAGPAGPQGPEGKQGPPGHQGYKGKDGNRGNTGGIGNIGPQGKTGRAGRKGRVGIKGVAGQDTISGIGKKGSPGTAGKRGLMGNPGLNGNQGGKGLVGPDGPKGKDGHSGYSGEDGEMGPPGEPGEPARRKEKCPCQQVIEEKLEKANRGVPIFAPNFPPPKESRGYPTRDHPGENQILGPKPQVSRQGSYQYSNTDSHTYTSQPVSESITYSTSLQDSSGGAESQSFRDGGDELSDETDYRGRQPSERRRGYGEDSVDSEQDDDRVYAGRPPRTPGESRGLESAPRFQRRPKVFDPEHPPGKEYTPRYQGEPIGLLPPYEIPLPVLGSLPGYKPPLIEGNTGPYRGPIPKQRPPSGLPSLGSEGPPPYGYKRGNSSPYRGRPRGADRYEEEAPHRGQDRYEDQSRPEQRYDDDRDQTRGNPDQSGDYSRLTGKADGGEEDDQNYDYPTNPNFREENGGQRSGEILGEDPDDPKFQPWNINALLKTIKRRGDLPLRKSPSESVKLTKETKRTPTENEQINLRNRAQTKELEIAGLTSYEKYIRDNFKPKSAGGFNTFMQGPIEVPSRFAQLKFKKRQH